MRQSHEVVLPAVVVPDVDVVAVVAGSERLHDLLDDPVQQVLAARDIPVERHRLDAERVADNLQDLLSNTGTVPIDVERRVLMFGVTYTGS